jgi:hypothetical protein
MGVDDEPEMLAHVTGAERVCADLYGLDLGRRFGAVVVASHLVNRLGAEERARLMDVCAGHVRPDGVVLIERYPPSWALEPTDRSGPAGPVHTSLTIHQSGPAGFSATAEYLLGDRSWRQDFSAEHVDDDMMTEAAATAGLRLVDWVNAERTWARLRPDVNPTREGGI